MEVNIIIGMVLSVFGLTLIILKGFWRTSTGIYEDSIVSGGRWWAQLLHYDKILNIKKVDKKYHASNNGLNVLGLFFIIVGIIIIFLPKILLLF